MRTITQNVTSIDRDHSQDHSRRSRPPIWTDRCACRHIAATHGPADGWNLTGVCLNSKCGCGKFRAVAS